MIHENFNFKEHGFAGHLAEPDGGSDRAVIVVMGGEQSLLPGIKFAERFVMYRTFGKFRKVNLSYFEKSEKEIIEWIN